MTMTIEQIRREPDEAEKRARLCRAADEGDLCGKCAKPFEPNEPRTDAANVQDVSNELGDEQTGPCSGEGV